MRPSSFAALVLAVLATVITADRARAQRSAAAPRTLPPLSQTCPMHPDVIERKPGSCPICKMNLVPVRLDTAWICPLHETVMTDGPGSCPICRRPLVEARVALTWTCKAQPAIDRVEPGTCPDGTPMVARRMQRPHGNHNPQHGGQFFMAADNWHHVEGTYPRAGVFRLYVYDDYARPLSAAALRKVNARVVTREHFDPATRTSTELNWVTLRPSRNGAYLEASGTGVSLPAAMTAKIRLKPDAPEYRFDFRFAAPTKEPVPVAPARASGPPQGNARKPAVSAPALESTPPVGPVLAATPIPETIPEILTALNARTTEAGQLIREGNFAAVWVPAFQAKDLAVALESRIGSLPPAGREAAEPAVQRVVRFAWLLDSFGDQGNRQQVEDAYAAFRRAVVDTAAAFAEAPR